MVIMATVVVRCGCCLFWQCISCCVIVVVVVAVGWLRCLWWKLCSESCSDYGIGGCDIVECHCRCCLLRVLLLLCNWMLQMG
jgi:hypothetical protein